MVETHRPFRVRGFPNVNGTKGNCSNGGSNAYDVIIVGGGAAGIGAAFGAAKAGASVLLIESAGCLGGAMTMRNVTSFCGIYTCQHPVRPVVAGVWLSLREKLLAAKAMYELPYKHRGVFLPVDPEKVKVVLDEFCEEIGVTVLLHATVVAAETQNDEIIGVTVQQRQSQLTFHAKAFVDASGDGDLSSLSGAAVQYGKEGQVQLGSLATRLAGFSHDARPTSERWSQAIVAFKNSNPELAESLHKNSSVLLPIPYTNEYVTFLASAEYDVRSAASISRAEREGRKQAQLYAEIIRTIDGHHDVYVAQSGPHFGTREGTTAVCQYTITKEDVMTGRKFPDAIALCGWGMEYHSSLNANWASSFDYVGGEEGVFDVPLRALLSKNMRNLAVAGRIVGSDKGASGSVRVMGTALATGQAAGVYAALLSAGECSSPTYIVREELLRQGVLLDRKCLGAPLSPMRLPFV